MFLPIEIYWEQSITSQDNIYPQKRPCCQWNVVTSGLLIPPNLSVLAFPQGLSCLAWLPAFNQNFSYLQGNHQHLASYLHLPYSLTSAKLISPCSKGKCSSQTCLILSSLFTLRGEVERAKRKDETVSCFPSALVIQIILAFSGALFDSLLFLR